MSEYEDTSEFDVPGVVRIAAPHVRERRPVPYGLIAAAVVVVLLAVLQAQPAAVRRVPDLRAMNAPAAATVAKSHGFAVDPVSVPGHGVAGTVLRQQPAPRSVRRGGSAIRLYVSAGAPQVQVPNVRGSTLAAAVQALTAAGLHAGDDVVFVESAEPLVVRTEPAAGRTVDRESDVRIYVGAG